MFARRAFLAGGASLAFGYARPRKAPTVDLPAGTERGAVSMWVQPSMDGRDLDLRSRTLFASEGPMPYALRFHLGPMVVDRSDMGDRPLLRFTAAGYTRRVMIPERVEFWRKGQRHHVVLNWNSSTGDLSAFIDGKRMPVLDATNMVKLYLKFPWKPAPASRLLIGAASTGGQDPWEGLIEDVQVFPQPLTKEEAVREFLTRGRWRVSVRPVDAFLVAGRQERFRLVFDNPSPEPATLMPSIEGQAGAGLGPVTVPPGGSAIAETRLLLPTAGDHTLTVRFGAERQRVDVTAIAASESRRTPVRDSLRPVCEVDAVATCPIAENAPSIIVESPLGRYRESGPRRHDRFAQAFTVRDLMVPHLAVIEYPDDKPRTMETILQRLEGPGDPGDYQAQTGALCGDEYPLSGRMQELRVVFWPAVSKLCFLFMSGEDGRPAAVRRIRIYRFDGGFSRRGTPTAPEPGKRAIGIYCEDPVLNKSFSTSAGSAGFGKSVDALLDYMLWSGQDTLHYPLVWYHGPLYGSVAEPFEADISTRPHPYDYPRLLMKRLESRGIKFNGGLHIHDLASLIPFAGIDAHSIETTVLNLQSNGRLKIDGFHGQDTSFNPVDPRVQAAVRRVVAEIADRYGDEPSFAGLTLVTARQKLFTFNSIDSGYNPSNIAAFQRETGMRKPEGREWLEWRCRKIHAYYRDLASALTSRRKDLVLTINLFPHFVLFSRRLSRYLDAPDVLNSVLKEIGIDLNLFRDEPNIRFSYTSMPADSRWLRSHRYKEVNGPEQRTVANAPELTEALRQLPGGVSTKIHDRYFEDAIGRSAPLRALGVQEQAWRVSTLNPAHVHCLEQYVLPLANFDALEIVEGGFVLGTLGMEDYLVEFAQEFRRLPAVRFDDVPGLEDPVRVRQCVHAGEAWFYVLNTLPAPATATLRLRGESDLALSLRPYQLRTFRRTASETVVLGGTAMADPEFACSVEARLQEVERSVPPSAYLRLAQRCSREARFSRLFRLLQEPWALNGKSE